MQYAYIRVHTDREIIRQGKRDSNELIFVAYHGNPEGIASGTKRLNQKTSIDVRDITSFQRVYPNRCTRERRSITVTDNAPQLLMTIHLLTIRRPDQGGKNHPTRKVFYLQHGCKYSNSKKTSTES